MLRSFYSGISGLRNHQQAMDVLGNNIANVNTVGFKGSRVSFMDTLSQTIQGGRQGGATAGGQNPTQVGLGMTVSGVARNFGQGPLQTTGNAMDLAIQGKGFFIVGQGDNFFYTRSGVFGVDNQNQLVTENGDLVYGWMDTNQDGVVDPKADELRWINLDRRNDGKITNVLSSVTPAVAGPNLGDATLGTLTTGNSTISDDWRVEVLDASTGEYRVVGAKTGTLLNEVTGLATTQVGETFQNLKLGSFVLSGGAAQQASLTIDYGGGNSIGLTANEFGAGGNNIKVEFLNRGKNQSLGVTFDGTTLTVNLGTDSNGFVTSTRQQVVDGINALIGTPVTAALTGADATVDVLSARYLQAGAGPNTGDYFTFKSTAPGGAAVQTITVAGDGSILGIFENGTTEEIARVALGAVANPQGLLAVGDGRFAESPTSGAGFPPRVAGTEGTGSLASGFLEMSNVDLTQEFTDMIVTQRGFQANSRIITTSDEMLQDLLALKR